MLPSFSVLFLVCVLIGVILWHVNSMAHELANRRSKEQCKRHQLQFLDGTTILDSIRFHRDASGQIGLMRRYHFDYYDGEARLQGRISVFRQQVTEFFLDTPTPKQPSTQTNPFNSANEVSNVIPFPKRHTDRDDLK